jgi:hypothetical protein
MVSVLDVMRVIDGVGELLYMSQFVEQRMDNFTKVRAGASIDDD